MPSLRVSLWKSEVLPRLHTHGLRYLLWKIRPLPILQHSKRTLPRKTYQRQQPTHRSQNGHRFGLWLVCRSKGCQRSNGEKARWPNFTWGGTGTWRGSNPSSWTWFGSTWFDWWWWWWRHHYGSWCHVCANHGQLSGDDSVKDHTQCFRCWNIFQCWTVNVKCWNIFQCWTVILQS